MSGPVYAEMAARIMARGKVAGFVRLSVNEWAGLTALEVKDLAATLASVVEKHLERRRDDLAQGS